MFEGSLTNRILSEVSPRVKVDKLKFTVGGWSSRRALRKEFSWTKPRGEVWGLNGREVLGEEVWGSVAVAGGTKAGRVWWWQARN